ncbi:MAG: CBS domain-containing protein [Byssovorax sp.]
MSLQRFEREVVTVPLDAPVIAAAQLMRDRRVGCVVVVREGRPVGILTDRDIALRIVAAGRDPERTLISQVVTFEAVSLLRTDTIETALTRMRQFGVRRLPIIDDSGQISGIVTADDLLPLLANELLALGSGVEDNVDASESR